MLLTHLLLIDNLLQNPIISTIPECVCVCVCVCVCGHVRVHACVCVHGEPETEGRAE